MRKICLLFCLIFLQPVFAEQPLRLDVQEFTLDNGLKILILERHDSPTFAAQMVFKVGSVDERPGITGVAHLLEHMMFKGTKVIGIKDYEQELPLLKKIDEVGVPLWQEKAKGDKANKATIRRLEDELDNLQEEHRKLVIKDELWETYMKNGGVGLNASTSSDHTHYYCALPSNRLELWCLLESDRMRSPVLREFFSERDVVAEERRRSIDNNPSGLMWENMIGTAFLAHPYQWPVIGWMSDIQTIQRSEVEEFLRIYYAPNNCAMAVVGDIYPDKALPVIERYFGDIPSQMKPSPVETVEPEQRGERRVKVEFDAEPLTFVGYHKPAIDHSDQYAIDIIEALLSTGRTSRLYKSLILEKQIAVRANAYGGPDKYPGLFIFILVPRHPHTVDEILAALDEEIERLAKEPVDTRELEKVKNRLRVDFIRELESNEGLADQIGFYEGLLNWEYINTLMEHREAVSAADIQRVIQKYFTPSNRTIVELVNTKEGGV
ncbi:MAG: pitrilysin family protein [bacterium]